MRRTKHGIPTKTPQMHAPDAACAALGRDVTVKSKRRSTDCEGQCKNNYGALDSLVQRSGDQRSGLNLSFAWSLRPVPQGALRQARILNLSCTKTSAFFLSPGGVPKSAPGRYPWLLHSRYRRARGNRDNIEANLMPSRASNFQRSYGSKSRVEWQLPARR